jgi:hypothetical protein
MVISICREHVRKIKPYGLFPFMITSNSEIMNVVYTWQNSLHGDWPVEKPLHTQANQTQNKRRQECMLYVGFELRL